MLNPTNDQFKQILLDIINQNSNISNIMIFKEILEDEKNITGSYPSSPGKPNLDKISSTGETAFQRAIFNGRTTLAHYRRTYVAPEKITWIDLEIPVVLNKNSRRRCLDLIGSLDGIPLLCELKYSKNNSYSDHPLYAAIELLTYYYFIKCNYKKLDQHEVHHHLGVLGEFKWEKVIKNKFPELFVAANEKYWEYWFNKIDKNDLVKQVFDLGRKLDTNIRLFCTPTEDFISQKGDKVSYKPVVTSNLWSKIKYDF